MLGLSLLKLIEEVNILNEVNAIDDNQANVLVLPEEGSKTPSSKVEFYCVHARKHEETLHDIADEICPVNLDLLFSSIWSKNSVQFVLIVDMADFLVEFSGTELTLDIEYDCA